MSGYVLAHDIGTSGNKATLFDEAGRLVTSSTIPYGTCYSHDSWAEQDPQDWWRAICESSRAVLSLIDPKELKAVAFSGQMMGCLCVDRQGRALHNSLIYSDQRSSDQERKLIESCGFSEVYQITGHRPSSSYSLTKLLWIREHRPDIFKRTYKVLQAKDYINLKLTGTFFTDPNDASGTNAYDLRAENWSSVILDRMHVDEDLFPEVLSSTSITGTVTTEASAESGIPEGTPVVLGSGDGGCATFGAGAVSRGEGYCYMGSSSWVSVVTDRPIEDPQMKTFTWALPIRGLYQGCGTMQTAGSSFSWFSKVFSDGEDRDLFSRINDLASASVPGSNGVIYLPYLLGERSPWWNSDAKAEFLGMQINTTKEDICRAVVEGIAMNLSLSLKVLSSQCTPSSLMFIGGGAQGDIWRRVFSDVFQSDLMIPTLLTEATSMGAALLGGVGAGLYPDFSMVKTMNPVTQVVAHDSQLKGLYAELTGIFEESYEALKPLFGKYSSFQRAYGTR